jgi:hypothetical protein
MITIHVYKKFLKLVTEKLSGEFLVVGGAVLPLLGYHQRATVDIDFIGLGKNERAQSLEIMRIASSLQLPPEAINSAAAIFIEQVKYTKADLIVLSKGPKATIFRPSTLFYMRLKFARMSESDFDDCKAWLQFFKNDITTKEKNSIRIELKTHIKNLKLPIDRIKRFQDLLQQLV